MKIKVMLYFNTKTNNTLSHTLRSYKQSHFKEKKTPHKKGSKSRKCWSSKNIIDWKVAIYLEVNNYTKDKNCGNQVSDVW